jgi:hypothetical protein
LSDFQPDAGDKVVDDPYNGEFYFFYNAAGTKKAFGAAQGGPLWVYPGVTNRLYILSAGSFSYSPTRSNEVKAWYRPRRLTL